ncbi:MAG: transcriptional regulator [Desulfurococcales archaeon]|nr:transcriptional regulator [Desulfurococcales archaeon]
MNKDQGIGWSIAVVSIIVIILYTYGVFATTYGIILLKLTGFVAVAAVFGILAWIGYTLATTPPPKPIEEIEQELEEELKKLEGEMKEEGKEGESKEEPGEPEKRGSNPLQ